MKVLVIGGGKVGYYLAKTLLERGYELYLIEQNEVAAKKLSNELDIPVICGDATELHTLECASIESVDGVLVVTGSDENNLVCCQLASDVFHKTKVVTKVNDPKNIEIFHRLGVGTAISSTEHFVKQLEREVNMSRVKELIAVGEDASIQEITLPEEYQLTGVSLSEIKLPQNCVIISITRDNQLIIPRGNTQLMAGDVLLALTRDKNVDELVRHLKLQTE